MNSAVLTDRLELNTVADAALKAATRLWFLMAVIGQGIFVAYFASLYGRVVVAGDLARWNKILAVGYVPGDNTGNFALAMHLSLAAFVSFGGPLQLIPQIRARVPFFHRWNGRVYMLTACVASSAALYLVWIRGTTTVDNVAQHIGLALTPS